jgi:predicted Zn-dependent protease
MTASTSFLTDPLQWFIDLKTVVFTKARRNELIVCGIDADFCEFARVSRVALVQVSRVEHISFHLSTGYGAHRIGSNLTLPTDSRTATSVVLKELTRLREWLDSIPEDPFFVDWSEVSESVESTIAETVPVECFYEDFYRISNGLDVVGLYANGPMISGWATSIGHFHWKPTHRYFFDFSVYAAGDKAVKDFVGGPSWDKDRYAEKIAQARTTVDFLMRPPVAVPTGKFRAMFSAESVSDLLSLSCWGGYSARAHLSGDSPFERLKKDQMRLSNRVTLYEDLARFSLPRVQDQGYLRPDRFDLIKDGRMVNWYCSPRTAKEFGVPHNSASSGESPTGLVLDCGDMRESDALERLDTGLYVSNLWYLNFSDRFQAAVTGMTRFASMWVENGRIVGPIDPLRFNDSMLNLFGEKLLNLGDTQEVFESTSTYGHRARGGVACPTALVQDLQIVS